MIIRDKMGATMMLAPRFADNLDALNAAAQQVVRRIVRDGEGVGAFIRPESVWISRRPDPLGHGELVDGVWAPDPTEGVILVGGPLDGLTDLSVPRGTGATPPRLLTMPHMEDKPEYARVGIDSERDQWVYEFIDMSN